MGGMVPLCIFNLENVSVENTGSEGHSVWVYGTKGSTMKNCNASHSKYSGLYVTDGGLMTIDGNSTTVHRNCTGGYSKHYGLSTHILILICVIKNNK